MRDGQVETVSIAKPLQHRQIGKLRHTLIVVYVFVPNFSSIGIHCRLCGAKTAENRNFYEIFKFEVSVLTPLPRCELIMS